MIDVMDIGGAFLAQHDAAFLESPYKPLLIFLSFVPWAWLISVKLEKDASFFHLNATAWTSIHLACGALALASMLFVPIFWVGWPLGLILMAAPILVYWQYRNQRVPEAQRLRLTTESLAERLEQKKLARAAREAAIQFTSPSGESLAVPLKDDPLYPIHMLAEDLVGISRDARATSLEILVGKTGAQVAHIVDGVRYKRDPLTADMALKVVDYLKKCAGLDLEDRRRRQTAVFGMRGSEASTELVATTAGSSSGLLFRIEFDRTKRLSRPFDGLGLLPSQLEALAPLTQTHERHGIVLIGAPPGHGLSTSMYSFLARHDAYTSNIKSLEREVLLELAGVDHVEWDPTNPDVDYATHLQSLLRRDPDVIMISFVKDAETARIATEPGMQGPLLYVPQRAGSVAEQIREWVKQVGDVKRATRALRAVVNQRLLRSLCPHCRQPYQPTAENLRKLGLAAGSVKQLFRPGGKVQIKNRIENCPVCGGSGYLGQVGAFEVFVVDDEARRLLQTGDLKAALAHARRNKMIYLQEAALSKVASGETNIEEVVRVTAPRPAAEPGGGQTRGAQSLGAGAGSG
jgi:type II secretory ATPase GspE/PulE/Tfp pilus assembly ATPase PilB-like protein